MIVHQWQNGGKLLVIAAATALSSVIVLVVIFAASWVWPDNGLVTVSFEDPLLIRPAVVAHGGKVNVEMGVCNETGDELTVPVEAYWVADSGSVKFARLGDVPMYELTLPPGCSIQTMPATLPADVFAGTWRLVGSARLVQKNGSLLMQPIASDPFEVMSP